MKERCEDFSKIDQDLFFYYPELCPSSSTVECVNQYLRINCERKHSLRPRCFDAVTTCVVCCLLRRQLREVAEEDRHEILPEARCDSAALASLPPAWPRASYTQLEGSRRAAREGRAQWHTPQYFQEEEGQHGLHAGSHGKDLTSTQTPPNCSNRPFCARAHRVIKLKFE